MMAKAAARTGNFSSRLTQTPVLHKGLSVGGTHSETKTYMPLVVHYEYFDDLLEVLSEL